MKAAFNVEDSFLDSIGCLNHTIQLALNDGLFSLPSVNTLMEECRSLVTYANQSIKFYEEFYRQQREIMNITNRQSLTQDNATR